MVQAWFAALSHSYSTWLSSSGRPCPPSSVALDRPAQPAFQKSW